LPIIKPGAGNVTFRDVDLRLRLKLRKRILERAVLMVDSLPFSWMTRFILKRSLRRFLDQKLEKLFYLKT